MQRFLSEGVDLAYLDEGEGEPILLVHGFASNAQVNWVSTGWVETLKADSRRVIAFDHRGHGRSEALHDRADYGLEIMAEDARRLLDHLGIARADVMGYSMGARVSATLAAAHPERVRSLVLAGMGVNLVRGMNNAEPIAQALEAATPAEVADPSALAFRTFADRTGSDRAALASCIRATRLPIAEKALAPLSMPVLIAVGTEDDVAGSAAELAQVFQDAEVLDIPRRDHMQAVGDKVYKAGVLSFLKRRP